MFKLYKMTTNGLNENSRLPCTKTRILTPLDVGLISNRRASLVSKSPSLHKFLDNLCKKKQRSKSALFQASRNEQISYRHVYLNHAKAFVEDFSPQRYWITAFDSDVKNPPLKRTQNLAQKS